MQLRVGIIGMGGFAGVHHDVIKQLEEKGYCRLVCTCDPNPEMFTDRMEQLQLKKRGVAFFDDYRQMLNSCCDELDLVTVPTPVPLHAPMHKACVERGIPVYLEKPPTLNYAELEEMLEVEKNAEKATNVGFNYIVEGERQLLKRRILDGEFGRIIRVSFLGLIPRPDSYFKRAPWAGRLTFDNKLVLDSCFGNAMAHFVHNVLFWAGADGVLSWGDLKEVESELYRANDIQGFDTVFTRAETTDGVRILAALSHACDNQGVFRETVTCENAVIQYTVGSGYSVERNGEVIESGNVKPVNLGNNLLAHFDYLKGASERPVNMLADCSPFVVFNSLLYIAAGKIATVPSSDVDIFEKENGSKTFAIRGLRSTCECFLTNGVFPGSQEISWASSGGTADIRRLPELESVITRITTSAQGCPLKTRTCTGLSAL